MNRVKLRDVPENGSFLVPGESLHFYKVAVYTSPFVGYPKRLYWGYQESLHSKVYLLSEEELDMEVINEPF